MNKNKVFIVTGGTSDIGQSIIFSILKKKAIPVLCYHSKCKIALDLQSIIFSRFSIKIMILRYDLSSPESPYEIVKEVLNKYGRIDGIINNASVFKKMNFEKISPEDWNETIFINLYSPFFMAQAAYSSLKKCCGSIVNISDINSEVLLNDYIPYCISKSALNSLTKALAKKMAPEVRVNTVSLGVITWPSDSESFPQTQLEKIISHNALKKIGHPQDIASAVAYLLFDAPYVTGHNLVVDGGRMLY